jgi:hypothetical protein
VGSSVSKEVTASIFRAQVRGVRNWVVYIVLEESQAREIS